MKPDLIMGGRYRLIDLLATGGEARVFRARDLQTDGPVAVRLSGSAAGLPSPKLPPDFHPSWVKHLDAGTDAKEGVYQVFELLEGETLRARVERGPLDSKAWLAFVQESLDAVGALHAAGWIHADLHAENFFLTASSPPSWKLLELPFFRAVSPGRSALYGSIHTLSPEQIDGHPAGIASDLYALGCLYYYAAAEEYPHPGGNDAEIVISRLRFPPVPLHEIAPGLSAAWCGWVMRLLETDPAKRFPSASAAHQLLIA